MKKKILANNSLKTNLQEVLKELFQRTRQTFQQVALSMALTHGAYGPPLLDYKGIYILSLLMNFILFQ